MLRTQVELPYYFFLRKVRKATPERIHSDNSHSKLPSYKDGKFPEEDPSKPYFPPSADHFKIPIFVIWNSGLFLLLYLIFISPVTRS
jgi:hypothetical protein